MRRFILWPEIIRPSNAVILADLDGLSGSDAIRQQIGELVDRAQAISDLAAEEERELTAEEKAEIDGILGVGKPEAKGHKPGKIDALEQDFQRAEKLEARQAELAKARGVSPLARADGPQREKPGDEDEPIRAASIRVPQDAMFQHSSLTAYKGPHARQEAYLVGQFLLGTIFKHEPSAAWCKDNGVDVTFRAAQSTDSNSLGGFLVPQEMEQRIIELREQYGVFRRNADVVPMSHDVKNQPYVKTDIEASFVGENVEIAESESAWGNAKLVAKKIGALVRHSNEIKEDAVISIADALTRQFARAFALKEDRCGFLGDGTSTYGGIVGLANALNAGSIHQAAAGNDTFGALDLTDFHALVGKLPEFAGVDAKWYVSKPGLTNSMDRLMAAAGGNTIETLANGARQRVFLGYPVEVAQVLTKALTGTADEILLYFGDLRMSALMGNRKGISIMMSDQRYFEYDQIGIRGLERFDITIHSVGDADEAGAIVALQAAS